MGTGLATMITAVAAAASVPASSTATKALWITSEMDSVRPPSMPEKSASSEKATGMPMAASAAAS